MGDEKDIGKTSVTYSGYMDWPGLYAKITGWAKQEGMKIFETVYKDKSSKDGFTERELELEFWKKVDQLNAYKIKVSMHLWDCQPVELTQNGTKQLVERGRIIVKLETLIDRDYQGIFEESGFWRNMRNVFYRLRKWEWLFKHADGWYGKMYALQKVIKTHLGMDTA